MTPKSESLPVRAAGFVIAHDASGARGANGGARLLLLRNAHRGEWGFPKGHLEPGEDLYAAAVRELEEETGIERFVLVPEFKQVMRYALASGKSKGLTKEVVYFLATTADDAVRVSREHSEARWANLDEALTLLTFGQLRGLARDAIQHLTRQA